jgi:hypothetical protein
MTIVQGGCACGAVRYEYSGDPVMMGHCQCRACQRESGTGHASHVAVAAGHFKVSGPITYWASKADSGNTVSRGFCSECGSPVASKNAGMPDLTFIRAASLDDPSIFKPSLIVWTATAQSWDRLDPSLPRFEHMPSGM